MAAITRSDIETICSFVRVGSDYITAVVAAGYSTEQATEWAKRSEQSSKGLYAELRQRLAESQAQCEILMLQKIVAEGGAAGARWILERTNPEKWDKRQKGTMGALPPPQGDSELLVLDDDGLGL